MVYEGNDNYIFVSYAHKDTQKVLPIIEVLNERGFRVWYDAGIEAGTEWPEYIEEHLNKARVVLVFMTPNTINSKNCRNEINFALELNKEILVVYLEDTELIKGMRLQLNSTQSLFRKNHETHETFIRELLGARILQSCRLGPSVESVPRHSVRKPMPSPTRISNICSIGTNDENDAFPIGVYSQTINRDRHSVIFFHINLLKPLGFVGKIKNKYQIYNSDNLLIFENEPTIPVQANYDKISTGWILKGDDGSFIPSGQYRFVGSVNDSPPFTYFFNVTSDHDPKEDSAEKPSFFSRLKGLFGN